MKNTSMTIAEYQGERVELRQLARQKGFNPQTIVDRWLKLGSPGVVDDAPLFYSAKIGGGSQKSC